MIRNKELGFIVDGKMWYRVGTVTFASVRYIISTVVLMVPFSYADQCLVYITFRQNSDGTVNLNWTKGHIVTSSYRTFSRDYDFFIGFEVKTFEDRREINVYMKNNSTAKIKKRCRISYLGYTCDMDDLDLSYFTFNPTYTPTVADENLDKIQRLIYPDILSNKIFYPADVESTWPGDTIVYQNLIADSRAIYHFVAFQSTSGQPQFIATHIDSWILIRFHSSEGITIKIINNNPDSVITASYDERYLDETSVQRIRNLTITLPTSTHWICNLTSRFGSLDLNSYSYQET